MLFHRVAIDQNVVYVYDHKIVKGHDPNLGLTTKARACKGAGQERKPGSHISCSRECKRV
jgi:hypothetical protein